MCTPTLETGGPLVLWPPRPTTTRPQAPPASGATAAPARPRCSSFIKRDRDSVGSSPTNETLLGEALRTALGRSCCVWPGFPFNPSPDLSPAPQPPDLPGQQGPGGPARGRKVCLSELCQAPCSPGSGTCSQLPPSRPAVCFIFPVQDLCPLATPADGVHAMVPLGGNFKAVHFHPSAPKQLPAADSVIAKLLRRAGPPPRRCAPPCPAGPPPPSTLPSSRQWPQSPSAQTDLGE